MFCDHVDGSQPWMLLQQLGYSSPAHKAKLLLRVAYFWAYVTDEDRSSQQGPCESTLGSLEKNDSFYQARLLYVPTVFPNGQTLQKGHNAKRLVNMKRFLHINK
jgi:hypothetical protein